MWIYQCEDRLDAILTGVYEAWSSRHGHQNVVLQVCTPESEYETPELFAEYVTVKVDIKKAESVATAIIKKISRRAYEMVVRAAASGAPDKGEMIYQFLVMGFRMGAAVTDCLTEHCVLRVYEMNRGVGHEAHLYTGFLRFVEVGKHILLACYAPKSNVTELVAPHFADRFSRETFIIYDTRRRIAAVHTGEMHWFLTETTDEQHLWLLEARKGEQRYETLWRIFVEKIAIKERENIKLQKSLCRLHYRKYMTEFIEPTTIKGKDTYTDCRIIRTQA